MAAPTFLTTGVATGATDAGGAWSYTGCAPGAIGNVVILQVLQDGTTGGAVTVDSGTNVETLTGTDNAWTSIGAFNVGSPTSALQHLWIGRTLSASLHPTATGSNSTSEDLYIYMYGFTDVNTGTTLASVIENGTAGSTANGVGTGTTVSDTAVTTLGPDRLALQFCAANDDVNGTFGMGAFTGETGGNWIQQTFGFGSASGTDGSVGYQESAMPSAGTIGGGSVTISSAGWGVVGFALIGTTVATQESRVHMAPHIPT